MNRFMAVSWAGLAVVAGCADGRSHPELMADAAADVEAVRLEHAMARYDTARTLSPADAEAHRRYATLANYFSLYGESARAWERVLELEPEDPVAWDGYITALRWACSVESNRRYGEKLLRVLPEALRHGSRRPGIYSNAEAVAGDLGELEAYGAILSELERWRPGDHVLLHRLESLRVRHANLEAGNRSRSVRDSTGAALDALAMRREGDSAIEAPVLYRLAAGYEMLDREKEADSWLGRLEAVPDRGVLADELRHRNLSMGFGDRLFGSSADASPQAALQIVDEGLKAADLGVRGVWVKRRHMAVLEQVLAPLDSDRSVRQALNGTVHVSAEPPGPTLDAEAAGQLFDAVVEVIRWQNGRQLAALNSLLYFGIHPRAVLDEAIAVEEALREDRPGYLAAAYRGDKRDREQQKAIDLARIAQARALTQLGEIEAAGRLFEDLASRSRGRATLGEYGRHLLRTDQPAEALDPPGGGHRLWRVRIPIPRRGGRRGRRIASRNHRGTARSPPPRGGEGDEAQGTREASPARGSGFFHRRSERLRMAAERPGRKDRRAEVLGNLVRSLSGRVPALRRAAQDLRGRRRRGVPHRRHGGVSPGGGGGPAPGARLHLPRPAR